MDKFIAYCGLNCEECKAYKATMTNDWDLKEKVAKEWSELNGAPIQAEFINCQGCRKDGVKTPFCKNLCQIRQCAIKNRLETCADCDKKNDCAKLAMVTDHNSRAKSALRLSF